MVLKELFEPNLTILVALVSHPTRSLLGAHSHNIIHQEWKLISKEEHMLDDISAHDEVHHCEVIVTICSFVSVCLRVVFPQGGGHEWGWLGGEIFTI